LGAFTTEGPDFDEFKLGRLNEKHAVANGNCGTISAFAWRDRGKPRKPVSRLPVAGPSGYGIDNNLDRNYKNRNIYILSDLKTGLGLQPIPHTTEVSQRGY
jgi:hypothetical protein